MSIDRKLREWVRVSYRFFDKHADSFTFVLLTPHDLPDTQRDIWIYVPQQFDPAADAAGFILFNDGAIYLDPEGAVRAAAVLDTMIHRGNLAPVIGIFVMPVRPLDIPAPKDGERMGPRAIEQRSYEYDSMHDKYAEFLAGEML